MTTDELLYFYVRTEGRHYSQNYSAKAGRTYTHTTHNEGGPSLDLFCNIRLKKAAGGFGFLASNIQTNLLQSLQTMR